MKIHAHILSWNEEKILPYTLDYYSQICEKIFIYDNMSDDGSDEIYKKYEKVEVIKWDSKNEINELNYINIKTQSYKERSRNQNVDWVIVCDCDEFLYHPNLMDKLSEYKSKGITVPKVSGHDMVSEVFPEYDGKLLTEKVKVGSQRYQPMCKNIKKRVNSKGYPNADSVMERGVLLPVHHGLTEKMFKRLHFTIDEFIKKIEKNV